MNADDTIRLPRAIVNEILEQAQKQPNDEICGLLGARGDEVTNAYPVTNVAGQSHSRYVMDPAGQIDAMRQMREHGERLFAIYHSHPASAALPSPTDIAEANYEDAVYLIVSLDTQGVLEMRAFRLSANEVHELPLELAP